MTTPDPLADITKLLRDHVADESDAQEVPEARAEAIAAIATALRARRASVRRRRFLGGLAVAASIGIAIGAVAALRHGSASHTVTEDSQLGRLVDPSGAATMMRDGHAERVAAGGRLPAGTELRTTTAEASLDFESGTHVMLGKSSHVHLVEQSNHKRFSLDAGELTARVAKLKADERFVVSTSDAEVEVRGTAFRVAVVTPEPTCGDGTSTRLDVTEGVVVVRHAGSEVRVAAGEHWPVCTSPPPAVETQPVASAHAAVATHTASPTASSRLAEQNDLFDEGKRLKRNGDAAGALARFEKLLAEYPSGPLAESAMVERMRILASIDRARAGTAARDYLRRFPKGYARSEAEALQP